MSYDSLVDPANGSGNASAAELDTLTKDLTQAVSGNEQDVKPDGTTALNTRQMQHQTEIQNAPGDNTQNASDPFAGSKFEGKEPKDVLDAYNNLQSAYGRMANDLGTQRQLTDKLLDLKRSDDLSNNSPKDPIQIDSGQLIDNPTQTLDTVLAEERRRNTEVLDTRLAQIEEGLRQQTFVAKHPDYNQVSNDPQFVSWLQSDALRSRAAQSAVNGDWEAADVLLTQYKQHKVEQIASQQDPNSSVDPNADARKVALESAATGSGVNSSGQTYSRAALMRLRIERPEVYDDPAFQQEILKAYQEKRVK